MKVQFKESNSNRYISVSFDYWIKKYVETGIAHKYASIKYPEIVELIIFDQEGIEIKKKYFDKNEASKKVRDNPGRFNIREVDIDSLKKNHLEMSRIYERKTHNKEDVQKSILSCSIFSLLINRNSINPKTRLSTPSKRHITIVVLMIITIIVTIIVALFA